VGEQLGGRVLAGGAAQAGAQHIGQQLDWILHPKPLLAVVGLGAFKVAGHPQAHLEAHEVGGLDLEVVGEPPPWTRRKQVVILVVWPSLTCPWTA
jgi:hypothetical protein